MATVDGYPHPDGTWEPCSNCGATDMDEAACPNAPDLCIDCCGDSH